MWKLDVTIKAQKREGEANNFHHHFDRIARLNLQTSRTPNPNPFDDILASN